MNYDYHAKVDGDTFDFEVAGSSPGMGEKIVESQFCNAIPIDAGAVEYFLATPITFHSLAPRKMLHSTMILSPDQQTLTISLSAFLPRKETTAKLIQGRYAAWHFGGSEKCRFC